MRWWKRTASLFFHLLVITGLCLAIFETVRSLYQGFNNVNQSMHWVLNNELYPAPGNAKLRSSFETSKPRVKSHNQVIFGTISAYKNSESSNELDDD